MMARVANSAKLLAPLQPMNPFESFLLRSEDDLISYFMSHIPVYDSLKFGSLNLLMRYFFDAYSRRAWNMVEFIGGYVNSAHSFLSLMDGKDAMIYGEAVLGFFLRSTQGPLRLDVCTTLPKLYDIQRALWEDGYRIVPSLPIQKKMYTHDLVRGIVRRQHKHETSWFQTGDRSDDPQSHIGFRFTYFKFHAQTNQRMLVNIHLIRCEPYRHVLATEFTPLTCYMTSDRAVSPFALSTFRDGLALVLQNKPESGGKQGEYSEFFRKGHKFLPVFGPPFGHEIYPAAEIGRRHLGDRYCWTILRTRKDPMCKVWPLKGPSFEVLDWEMLHDGTGTYMRIGEPFVWRYYYAVHQAKLAQQEEESKEAMQFGGQAGGF